MTFRHISILGLGLLGGSIGRAVKSISSDCKITGYDVSNISVRRAVEIGAIDGGSQSFERISGPSDLIILCVPVGAVEAVLAHIAPVLPAGAVITDVCSTKRSIVGIAEKLLPASVQFVGSHPIAGSEQSGIESARANLFEGALCLLTPTAKTDPQALERVESFWRMLGMQTHHVSPKQHDHLVAEISHGPHALASALMSAVSDDAKLIAGPGFRDVTRIAAGDGALWRDILRDNADEVRQFLRRVRDELDALDALLEPDRAEHLRAWLDAAAARRRELGKPEADARR